MGVRISEMKTLEVIGNNIPKVHLVGVILLFCVFAGLVSPLQASLILTFANNDSLEGDGVSDTSDPFTDPDTNISATLTTRAISPNGVLNPNAGSLGINADGGGDSSAAFDVGESWTFDWNVATLWEGIDFDGVNQSEIFTVSSSDFVGLGITPTSSAVI